MIEREQAEAKKKLLEEARPGQSARGSSAAPRLRAIRRSRRRRWPAARQPDQLGTDQASRTTCSQSAKGSREDREDRPRRRTRSASTLRDLSRENPWTNVTTKYPVTARVTGKRSKLTDFGAFVRLEPGVEGLIHISQLAHGRVFRASDVVSEGQEVEVKVLSVDPEPSESASRSRPCKPAPSRRKSRTGAGRARTAQIGPAQTENATQRRPRPSRRRKPVWAEVVGPVM